jgi:hypothetical protein
MIGWTYEQNDPGQVARMMRKYMKGETARAADATWMPEEAEKRWGTARLNAAVREMMNQGDHKEHSPLLARETSEDWYEAARALRQTRVWCPEERDETGLTKFLKHQGRLTFSERVRLLAHAKELRLVPHKKLRRFRDAAHAMCGKALLKCA